MGAMDEEYRQQLRIDADAGNNVAERLLLNSWLAERNHDEINGLLERRVAGGDAGGARFLQAELRCFHDWPGVEPWQELLKACCDDGCKEAHLVTSMYHDWASSSGAIPASDDGRYELWAAGWDDWRAPDWTTVIEKDCVVLERSGPFVPQSLIGFVRSLLGPQLLPAAVVDPASGVPMAHPVRINQGAQWLPEHLGWIGKLFECRLAEVAGYDISHGEVLNLLHYRPGQRYKPHLDCISSKQAASPDGQAQGGQRLMTVLLAMGDDSFDGGETHFPRLQISAKSVTGELIRFNNSGADGKPLQNSIHEGRAVVSGEKWLLSKWVRELPTPYGKEVGIIV